MTVRMSDVWERTVQIVQGRSGMIVPIALLALFLPAVIGDAIKAYSPDRTTAGIAAARGLVALITGLAAIWGQLAIMAIASDPATTRTDATRTANARFGPSLAVAAVEVAAVILLFLPALIPFAMAGANLTTSTGFGATVTRQIPMTPGVVFASFYSLAFAVVLVIVSIRLLLVQPVILHERVGLRALARSWRLTNGIGWRLFGVLLLAIVVLLVASAAATSLTGIIAALIIGKGGTATFLALLVSRAIVTGFSVLVAIFIVQLYLARRDPIVST